MANEFWLNEGWAAIEPLVPKNQPGARRVNDRRVISGIVHVLRSGCRWKDCPSAYGPPTTIYNRYNRWSRRGIWMRIFAALVAAAGEPDEVAIDSTHIKAHRSAAGLLLKRLGGHGAVALPRSMLSLTHRDDPAPSFSRPAMSPTFRSRRSFSKLSLRPLS